MRSKRKLAPIWKPAPREVWIVAQQGTIRYFDSLRRATRTTSFPVAVSLPPPIRVKRENVVGRANVEDTPELEAYYRALEGEELGALWNVANEIEPWYPQPKSVPTLWAWKRVEPYVRKAAKLVSAEKAARRVVMLVNPGRKEWSAAAGLLYTGVQVMNPGEFTSAHRHQASALRFVMDGKGAYTVVDGERMTLGARDFVLTPNGTWHDHGVEADGTQCTWQDGLDIPLMNSLDANFYEVHPQVVQTPARCRGRTGASPYSPVFLYKWDESYSQVKQRRHLRVQEPADRRTGDADHGRTPRTD